MEDGSATIVYAVQVSLTVTGDAVCKATDVTFRLDTPEAREFLSEFITLP